MWTNGLETYSTLECLLGRYSCLYSNLPSLLSQSILHYSPPGPLSFYNKGPLSRTSYSVIKGLRKCCRHRTKQYGGRGAGIFNQASNMQATTVWIAMKLCTKICGSQGWNLHTLLTFSQWDWYFFFSLLDGLPGIIQKFGSTIGWTVISFEIVLYFWSTIIRPKIVQYCVFSADANKANCKSEHDQHYTCQTLTCQHCHCDHVRILTLVFSSKESH